MDDVLIHSSTWDDHLEHLREVLRSLRKARLMANPKKCHLGLTKAHYLGYRIGWGLLKPQEKKLEAVKGYSWLTSKNMYMPFWGWRGTTVDSSLTSPL